MPTQDFGVYPDSETAGTEVSSTYEGRHVTVQEQELVHPTHADGFVDKGDPVVFGPVAGNHGVGVAFTSAAAVTDLIAIDTEGIWNLSVVATDDNGNSLVTGGDPLYINTTTCVISKIRNTATQIPFGYALGQVAAAATAVIAVKVHWDPSLDTNDQMFKTVTSGAYSYGKQWVGLLEAGESTGVAGYFCAQVDGQQTGGIYGWGAWTEIQAGFLHLDNYLLVAGEFGIWDGSGGDIGDNWIVLLQLQAILAAAPNDLNIFRVNVAAAGGAVQAIFAAANPTSLGYSGGTAGTGVVGTIPFADIVGVGTVYIDVHAAVA